MADVVTLQEFANGAKNYHLRLTGILDTANVAKSDLIDPSSITNFNPPNQGATTAFTTVNIEKIIYDIEDSLSVNLYWDANTDVLFATLVGRGELCFVPPLLNNASTGKTGKVQYETTGFSGGAVLSFNVLLYCNKTTG